MVPTRVTLKIFLEILYLETPSFRSFYMKGETQKVLEDYNNIYW